MTESAVISTCNRVEIYVETDRFHGAVEEVSRLLAEHAHLDRDQLVSNVYVHYDDSAVAHLFAVASGLDSMIIGESQILGQVRDTLLTGQAESTVGSALNALFQQALRIGKRGHAETGIDHLAPSIATAALDAAGEIATLPTTRFVVVGAGAMAGLAVRSLVDRGVDPVRITVVNRTTERGEDLAASVGAAVRRLGRPRRGPRRCRCHHQLRRRRRHRARQRSARRGIGESARHRPRPCPSARRRS